MTTYLPQLDNDRILLQIVFVASRDLQRVDTKNLLHVCCVYGDLTTRCHVRASGSTRSNMGQSTDLGFPHNLAPRPDPRDKDELLALRFFIVGILYPDVCERSVGLLEFLAQLLQASGSRRRQRQLIRARILDGTPVSASKLDQSYTFTHLVVQKQPIRVGFV